MLSGAYKMAVSDQIRSGDLAKTFKSERDTTKNQIRVALLGIVQSFDPGAVTAVVLPAIRSVEIDNDGNRVTKNIPLLVDVPVVFPRGSGYTLTFPVKAGDECLVVFFVLSWPMLPQCTPIRRMTGTKSV